MAAARSGARIGQIQIGRMPISRMQEGEELRGARERNVDVLDHRFRDAGRAGGPARASSFQRLFQRMIFW